MATKRINLTAYQLTKIVSLYKDQHVSSITIAAMLGISQETVIRRLREQGVAIRSRSGHRQYWHDSDFFKRNTPERDYVVGLLLADGFTDGRLQFKLTLKEREHVEKIASLIGNKSPIKKTVSKGRYVSWSLVVCDMDMVKDIVSLGVVRLKSGREWAHHDLAMSRDFWRGVIDGDGCLGYRYNHYPLINLCGSRRLLEQFCEFVEAKLAINPRTVMKHSKIFYVTYYGSSVPSIARLLYQDASISLDRKQAIANDHMNNTYWHFKGKNGRQLLDPKTNPTLLAAV